MLRFLVAGILFVALSAAAQSTLPLCPIAGVKHNCKGEGLLPEGGSYKGEYRFDMPNGFGEVVFSDGSRYVGLLANGNYQGFGTFFYPNKDRYVGEWVNDKFHGSGTYFFANGLKFTGRFRDGRPNGEGTEYNSEGEVLRSGWWLGRQVFPNRQALIQSYAECLAATAIAKAQGTMSGLADVTLSMGRMLNQLNERYTAIATTQSELDRMNQLAINESNKYAYMGPRQGIDFAFRVIEINRCSGLAVAR